MKKLIDRDEILSFPNEEYSGFCNFVYDLIHKHDFGDREDDAMNFAEDIFDGIMNVIETAEVVEERETTTCVCSMQKEDTYDCFYEVYYYTCGNCFESVKTENEKENFKFCPHCGAKYEKIVRY